MRSPFSLSPSNTNSKPLQDKLVFDLFITSEDERLVEPVIRNVVWDTIDLEKREKPVIDQFKNVLNRFSELDERIRTGKPILGLNPKILKTHLEKLFDFSTLHEIEAEKAYTLLKNDRFDIAKGSIGGYCN